MPSTETLAHIQALENVDFDFIRGPQAASLLKRRVTELGEAEGPLGVDTETTGLDPLANRVRLIQVASCDYALVVDVEGWRTEGERQLPWDAPGLQELKALLEGPQKKVLQNAAFDLNFLAGEGVELGGSVFDTMIAAKVVNNGTGAKNDLGSLVSRVLKVPLSKELQKADWGGEISDEMVRYAARDAVCLPRMVPALVAALKEAEVSPSVTLWDVFKLEMKALRPIARMQWNGFGFDAVAAAALQVSLQDHAEALKTRFLEALDEALKREHPDEPEVWLPREPDDETRFNTRERDSGSLRLGTKRYKGFNPRSPQQMAEKFELAGVLMPPNAKGLPSLDQNLLAFLRKEYKLVAMYLEWKTAVTRVSHIEKLLDSIGPDGRIHAGYRQMGTETGRLSCSSPNLQQVPKGAEFRGLFRAREGYQLVVADFSQVELRVAAELSGEERMRTAYRDGRDLHIETAALVTGKSADSITKKERTSAKICNFGLLYGAGPATLRKQAVAQYGVDMELEEAKELVVGFREAYPRLYEWQMQEGNKTTKGVFTRYGRRRILTGFNDKYTTRINTQVQGTAGDVAKIALVMIWDQIQQATPGEALLIAMVHDEIVLEVVQDRVERWSELLSGAMEAAGSVICKAVPIVAEASSGDTWADAK
jgi:DNA polymerase I-like protein with 3'-5' exonuclease and polymerase domains